MKEILHNSIILGDIIEELKKIPDQTFDCIFADPPYNLQLNKQLRRPDDSKVKAVNDKWDKFEDLNVYDKFSSLWIQECHRVLKDNGTIWVIGTYHNIFR